MGVKIVDKHEKRGAILHAAVKVFVRKGFSRTTISDIAKQAGIGKGTIYEYFKTKEEIIHETFRHFLHELEPGFEEILLSEYNAREKLEKVLLTFQNLEKFGGESVDLLLHFWAEGMVERETKGLMLKELNDLYTSFRGLVSDIILEGMTEGIFRKDLNPEQMASIIIGMLDGVFLQWRMALNSFDYQGTLHTLISMVLRSLEVE